MMNFLMRNGAIILQDVIVCRSRGFNKPLQRGQYFSELIIRDVLEFGTMVFRDDKSMTLAQWPDV